MSNIKLLYVVDAVNIIYLKKVINFLNPKYNKINRYIIKLFKPNRIFMIYLHNIIIKINQYYILLFNIAHKPNR